MLKGFTVPRSPLGAAALSPPPPWYFAGDVLAIEFWNDPDVSIYTLPAGMEFDEPNAGHSMALFTDYQFTAGDEEYLDPARYQCRGFSVLLDAIWNGTRVAWCPFSFVDNDAAMMRGWIQGYPKKLGVIHQTRTFAAHSRASAPLGTGSRLAACASAHGQLLAQARVTLSERGQHLIGLLDRPIVVRRHFPCLSQGKHDKPAVDELVRCVTRDLSITDIWIGEGELTFPEVCGEELEILGPIRVGRGVRFSFGYSIADAETLVDLRA